MATTNPTDVQTLAIQYPDTAADLALQLRTGPCRVRFAASDGPTWIAGTYRDPTHTLPLEIHADGPTVTIAQRVDLTTWGAAALPVLDLAIARTRPFALDIQTGATENACDLGGLPLTRLVLKGGAGKFEIDFSRPSDTPMALMDLGMGAGSFTARHLANASFSELRLGGGVSACLLDFSGELRHDAHARLDAGLGSLDLLVPATTSARVSAKSFLAGKTTVGFVAKGDSYYTAPALEGKHPLLEIDVSIAFGSLTMNAT